MNMKTKYNITLSMLYWYFPEDTLWRSAVAEFVGYSQSENKFFVINDGCCCSDDGEYLVHIYELKKPLKTFDEILKSKYFSDEDVVSQKEVWMTFKTREENDDKEDNL